MLFTPTPLAGSYVVDLETKRDDRGWFVRFFDKEAFATIGHHSEWLQLNHSFTASTGSVRGIHFQNPPFDEIKLVRCIAGAVFDIIVDLRENSPTFLQWYGVDLDAQNQRMLYIPAGMGHGFQTTQPNTELIYHHSATYQSSAESGVRYDDPAIGIRLPLPVTNVSIRDQAHPFVDKSFKGIKPSNI